MPIELDWFPNAKEALSLSPPVAGVTSFRPLVKGFLDGRPDGTEEIRQLIYPGLTEYNSICFLTGISGRWDGSTELVKLYLDQPEQGAARTWYYDLKSGRADITAWLMVIGLQEF